jgi:hypothetical protein
MYWSHNEAQFSSLQLEYVGSGAASDATGVDFSRFTSLADVKAEIKRTFTSMVANMRDNLGQPMFKGAATHGAGFRAALLFVALLDIFMADN